MTQHLPDEARAWLDGGEFVTVATVLAGGQPHLSVLWADRDGDDILLSTLEGRVKHRNLLRDSQITVLCYPRANPYSYLEVRGTAAMTREGAPELIEKLSQRYVGKPFASDGPGDVRVVIRVRPDKVVFRA